MNIQLVSDLHLDHGPFTLKPHSQADVIVLAGDFGAYHVVAGRVVRLLTDLRRATAVPIIVVLGNHDYYGNNVINGIADWTKLFARFADVCLLVDSSATLFGVEFVGGTLWTDYTLYEPDLPRDKVMATAQHSICDFGNIDQLQPKDLIPMHERCCDVIEGVVSLGRPTVIVTHFVPTERAISPYWQKNGRPLNPYFCSPCEYLARPNVRAWLFGHTHTSADVVIDSTRFVCNPRGYNDHENRAFSSQLLIDIGQ